MVLRYFLRGSALICAMIASACNSSSSHARTDLQPHPASTYIRHEKNDRVIVFVHGITGNSQETWLTADRVHYWPDMLKRDPFFNSFNIYVYQYPTSFVTKSFTVSEVADNMRLVLKTDGVLSHDKIVIVSHSMGGLVTRDFILRNHEIVPKVQLLYFFATPTQGAPAAALAANFSRNPQLGQLYPMTADNYLGERQGDWLAARLGIKSYCAYETQPIVPGFEVIVDIKSATPLCTEPLDPIDANHITIVKPASPDSTAYRALKSAIDDTLHASAPPRQDGISSQLPTRNSSLASKERASPTHPEDSKSPHPNNGARIEIADSGIEIGHFVNQGIAVGGRKAVLIVDDQQGLDLPMTQKIAASISAEDSLFKPTFVNEGLFSRAHRGDVDALRPLGVNSMQTVILGLKSIKTSKENVGGMDVIKAAVSVTVRVIHPTANFAASTLSIRADGVGFDLDRAMSDGSEKAIKELISQLGSM